MAEILVRINVPSEYIYSNNDVVAVMPDNHNWGAAELDTSIFKIVSVPGAAEELKYLIGEDSESPIDAMPPAFRKDPKLFLQYILKTHGPGERVLKNVRRYRISDNNQIIDKRSV